MRVLSLFDGDSGGRIALERSNISVEAYFASEIDKYAIQVSKANYPDIVQLGEINHWKEWNLPEIDMIIGGSPCQGFSFSGKQLAFDDPRSKLFFKFCEVLDHYRPKYFLLENVVMKQEFQDVISSHLGVEPIKIDSSLVSAQSRKRLYWTNIPGVTQPEDRGILSKHQTGAIRGRYRPDGSIYQNIEWRSDYKHNTLTTVLKDNIVRYADGDCPGAVYRYLTPEEYEILQTVPVGYTDKGISNSQRYKMLGNGFTVDVIAHIFNHIPRRSI
jgi:site-specific DNA-cytosine methylase